jgi:hypothetical protein
MARDPFKIGAMDWKMRYFSSLPIFVELAQIASAVLYQELSFFGLRRR